MVSAPIKVSPPALTPRKDKAWKMFNTLMRKEEVIAPIRTSFPYIYISKDGKYKHVPKETRLRKW